MSRQLKVQKMTKSKPVNHGKSIIKYYEVPRRIWHSSIGFLIILLKWLNVPVGHVIKALVVVTAIYSGLDILRLYDGSRNNTFCTSFPLRYILRDRERSGLTSSTYFLFGAITTLSLYAREVSFLALMYLSWCDPVAAIVGKSLNHSSQKRGKTLAGSTGAAIMGFLITITFLSLNFDMNIFKIILKSVLGGAIAALSEAITINGLDDNVTLPIIAGFLLTIFGFVA